MKLTLISIGLFLLPALTFGSPSDLTKLKSAKIPQAKNASCKTCHPKGKELNAFGKAYMESDRDFSKMKVEGKETGEKVKDKAHEMHEKME